MIDLTDRQKKVLKNTYDYILRNGYPPAIRELAGILGLSSPRGVYDHLLCLEKKGYIKRKSSARSIRLTGKALDLLGHGVEEDIFHLPLIGNIAAGKPVLAEENIEEYIAFPAGTRGAKTADFALRVQGDSMTGDHILDGDIIAVRSQPDANNGDIVVALIEDEAVVKRFYRTGESFELRSSNPAYLPIKADGALAIQGKVVAVQRTIS
ncbi:MAG: transcriptional repressor LexA [Actinobacteria bacterium]|nr:transcriptional repressor LexA [Actinomycetota bacterium]